MWRGVSRRISGSSELRRLDRAFSRTSGFKSAEPLLVRLRGLMIREDLDGLLRGENDLMVVTNYAFGDDPPVDRLHFMERNATTGWYGDFFDDVVVSVRDLTQKRLKLRIQVYDLDGVNDELVTSVEQFASTTAVTFPQLAPYAGLVGLGAEPLRQLVDHVDAHDRILDETLILEVADPDTGHKLLQPGYFVCFGEEAVEEGLSLRGDLRVAASDGEEYGGSYAVLEVDKDYEEQRDREIDQKVAKLVAQLRGKGRSAHTSLYFLRDTLNVYTAFRRLDRAKALERKAAEGTITPEEQRLLEELRADEEIGPYLDG